MLHQTYTLPNGLRLIHQRIESPVAYCGMLVNTGTRDERPEQAGLAHLLEHAIFKGTQKRKAYHVLSRLEDVGGEMNAYTTKEDTFLYSIFLRQDLERAMELTQDMLFNSIFPEKELEKEKEVVIDEMNSYKDSPADFIFDDFESLLYRGHPLGHDILGSPETLRALGRDDLRTFIELNYNTDQMVFCTVADWPFEKVCRLFDKHYGPLPPNPRSWQRQPFAPNPPLRKTLAKGTHQKHCILGALSYHQAHENKTAMYLLANLLGGPSSNCRLNLSLREKRVLAYSVEANFAPYSDTGSLAIYFGTDPKDHDKALRLVWHELDRLRQGPLGRQQLAKAKSQLKGQIAISSENKENLLIGLAKSLLTFGSVDDLEDIYQKIDSLEAQHILDVAQESFRPELFSMLAYE